MSTIHSPKSPKLRRDCPERRLRDGWTPERQLRFLETLARTRNVAKAAASAGMSRESAHRLRNRDGHALFAALWDLALAPEWVQSEGHSETFTDGRLTRLLGFQFRGGQGPLGPNRAGPL